MSAERSAASRPRYRTIVADPPWHYEAFANNVGTGGRVELPYASMTLDEIAAVPVASLAATDCRLFLWATSRYVPAACEIMHMWGFEYSRALVWHKPDPPPVTRNQIAWYGAEFILVGRIGAPKATGIMPSVITHPNMRHSQKPECFLDFFEQVSPGPYLEMFSRRARLGWDTYGDEALHGTELVA